MDLQLKDKKALVTGSTAGIGFATARALLQEGAIVYINGRKKERVDEALKELRAAVPNAQVEGIVADFAKVDEINALIERIPDIDILINNVGIYSPKPFEETTDEDWLRHYEINVLSGVRLSRHYFPSMMKKNWGRIIFISSESAINIPEDMIHYGMSKTALLAISRGLAELTKGTNVTVNSILPGPTRSDGVIKFMNELATRKDVSTAEAGKFFFREVRPTSLLQRFATTEEVANMIVYVSSPLSSATNGAALRVDGGVIKSI